MKQSGILVTAVVLTVVIASILYFSFERTLPSNGTQVYVDHRLGGGWMIKPDVQSATVLLSSEGVQKLDKDGNPTAPTKAVIYENDLHVLWEDGSITVFPGPSKR